MQGAGTCTQQQENAWKTIGHFLNGCALGRGEHQAGKFVEVKGMGTRKEGENMPHCRWIPSILAAELTGRIPNFG
ncbi:hypothetical protein Y1Q_0010658 [Alligator mississippiensis]|uniref:Uncharacterized protein n=1 Tax=Alligator mississippiensis TaxID=8496 RepID=A0A151M6F0_ALLMI|nr:hypothetical protein Y1Q_0010658 [Alligator mississippiensis]